MSNAEDRPDVIECPVVSESQSVLELIPPRNVPLGGLRAMTVRRTLPSRQRSLIGAWCFVDHYGPDVIAETGGMDVAPHPHIGLQTVSWLFTGEVEHRDSAGNHAIVRPGEVNLMTAGRGISHSEISMPGVETLHGVQLWVALPADDRATEPHFDHYRPEPVAGEGFEARVFLGSMLGSTSPVPTYSPLLGAELILEPGASVELDLDETFEHGFLVDSSRIGVRGSGDGGSATDVLGEVDTDALGYLAPGSTRAVVTNLTDVTARVMVLGGTPFGEPIVMWWNFIGRSHDEIAQARDDWNGAITDPATGELYADAQDVTPSRFGVVIGDHLTPIRCPEMPRTNLLSRW